MRTLAIIASLMLLTPAQASEDLLYAFSTCQGRTYIASAYKTFDSKVPHKELREISKEFEDLVETVATTKDDRNQSMIWNASARKEIGSMIRSRNNDPSRTAMVTNLILRKLNHCINLVR